MRAGVQNAEEKELEQIGGYRHHPRCLLFLYYHESFFESLFLTFVLIPNIPSQTSTVDLNQKQASVTTTTSSCVSAEEGGTDLEEHDPDHSQLQSTTTTTTTTTTVGDVLSVPQLVLRRGLALLVMVVILVAGIISSDLLVRLLKE